MIKILIIYDKFSIPFKLYAENITDNGYKNHILNSVMSDEYECTY